MENKKLIIINIITITAFIIIVSLGLSKSKTTTENFKNIEDSKINENLNVANVAHMNAISKTSLILKYQFNFDSADNEMEELKIKEIDDLEEEEDTYNQLNDKNSTDQIGSRTKKSITSGGGRSPSAHTGTNDAGGGSSDKVNNRPEHSDEDQTLITLKKMNKQRSPTEHK